jgi:hypothetical protein
MDGSVKVLLAVLLLGLMGVVGLFAFARFADRNFRDSLVVSGEHFGGARPPNGRRAPPRGAWQRGP